MFSLSWLRLDHFVMLLMRTLWMTLPEALLKLRCISFAISILSTKLSFLSMERKKNLDLWFTRWICSMMNQEASELGWNKDVLERNWYRLQINCMNRLHSCTFIAQLCFCHVRKELEMSQKGVAWRYMWGLPYKDKLGGVGCGRNKPKPPKLQDCLISKDEWEEVV